MPGLNAIEADVLQYEREKYELRGYQFIVAPHTKQFAGILGGASPDAVAIKGPKKIAIEIVSGRRSESQTLFMLREYTAKLQDWQLRVIHASAPSGGEPLRVLSAHRLLLNLNAILDIPEHYGRLPVILSLWSIFEAAGRRLLADRLRRPQTPASLIEALASDGRITPTEGELLRRIAKQRNLAAHGEIDINLSQDTVQEFAMIIRTLLEAEAERPD